jgi:parallel beta-helix repeat protein
MKQHTTIIITLFLLQILLFNTGIAHQFTNLLHDDTSLSINPRIIYVDDDNVNGPWFGTLEHPFKYIRWGLGAAFDGDIVFVFNGFYKENSMEVYNQITLQGENRDNTIIDGNGYSIIDIMKHNVIITGFTFQNALEYTAINIISNHITITNNIITTSNRGINMPPTTSTNITISHNIIRNHQDEGIQIWSDNDYLTITNNTFINNRKGIVTYGEQHHSTIEHNNFLNNNNGLSIWNGHNLTIQNNNFKNNRNTALNLHYSKYSIILHNTFNNNTRGIMFYSSKGNQFIHNNFIRNEEDATFLYYEKRERSHWRHNYWDDWFKILPIPRPIKGKVRFYDPYYYPYDRTWYNIDWRPSLKPNEI